MAMTMLRAALASSPRPLLEEPIKSLVTLAAALAGRILSPEHFARLIGRAAGGRLVA